MGRIQEHLKSSVHKISVEVLESTKSANSSIMSIISDAEKIRLLRNRVALCKIFGSLNYLAQQGLPIRGAKDDQESNLQQVLKLRAEDVPELAEYLSRDGRKWLSPDIQNEMLGLISTTVLKGILEEIRSCEYFSIMLDETPDAGRLEQISICVKVVTDKFVISEYFLGFYNTVHGTTAETLLKIVKDVFARFELDITKLRGQCYDGASNMSGRKNGLQAKTIAIEPQALFVHCNAHNLNLVVQDAISEVPWTRQYIGIVKEMINFIRDSPKRLAEFRSLADSSTSSLKPYSATRLVEIHIFKLIII